MIQYRLHVSNGDMSSTPLKIVGKDKDDRPSSIDSRLLALLVPGASRRVSILFGHLIGLAGQLARNRRA